MAQSIDRDIVLGFIEEARGYLPKIRDGLERAASEGSTLAVLEESHRLIHSIKGAASMIGESALGHIAFYAEESIEHLGAQQLQADARTLGVLQMSLDAIATYLDQLEAEDVHPRPLLEQVVPAFRRLYGESEADDQSVIEQLLTPPGQENGGGFEEPIPTSAEGAYADLDAQAFESPFADAAEPPAFDETGFASADGDFASEASPELLEAFYQEAEDHLQNVGASLRDLERQPDDKQTVQAIQRRVHTLKGAAAMIGLAEISRLAHRMEDLLDHLHADTIALDSSILQLLFSTTDALTDLTQGALDVDAPRPAIDALYDRFSTLLGAVPADAEGSDPDDDAILAPLGDEPTINVAEMATDSHTGGADSDAPAPRAPQPAQIVRVPIERLDELVRLVSELVVNRSTFEQHFRRYGREVGELRLSTDRLRRIANRVETEYEVLGLSSGSQFGIEQPVPLAVAGGGAVAVAPNPHGFDDLELDRYTEVHLVSRELSETTADIGAIGGELSNEVGDFDSFLNALGRLTGEIQDKLMQLRMVPFASLASRLHRAVRVTASSQGKLAELVIEGGETDLDKGVLEAIADPLLHLLRNAVDHGIEPSALRQAIGKPERGEIRIRVFHQATNVVIEIHDDGAGLDPDTLRAAAIEAGYLSEADATELGLQSLQSLMFLPGFSTASSVSEVSGRGVGLDVVKTSVAKSKGTISVTSTPGTGTCFTIRLPMTLAIVRVLLVRSGPQTIAVPLATVTKIVRREREEIETLGDEPVLRIDDEVYPTITLSRVLGQPPVTEEVGNKRLPVLVLDLGDRQIALVVDQILEAREVVVKSLGSLLRRVRGISGSTLMGDGSVVLILNPDDLIDFDQEEQPLAPPASARVAAEHLATRLDVLVVDDSVSVRRLLSNLIRMAGWNPITARDGLDALETIQRLPRLPDVVLLDLEMPRMDGYELTSTLRAEARYKDLPIVIVTSRAGDKHRKRAFDLGVTEYLVKPYNDETLLNVVRRLAREAGGTGDR